MSSMKLTDWGMLVILSIFWGGSFFFVEVALRGFQPLMIVFLRVTLGALILTGVVYLRGQRMPSSLKSWGAYLILGALNNAIPFSLIVWGQTRIDAGAAAILNATTPIFAVLLAQFLTSDEHLTLRKLMGVLIGFLGVYIMLSPELKNGFSWRGFGQLAVIGASVSYSFAGIFGKRFKKESPVVISAAMLLCSSLMMLPLVVFTGAIGTSKPSVEAVGAVLGIATISTAMAYLLYFRILASAGATNVLLVTLLIPISAVLLGVGVLREVVHILEYTGMGFIFIGLALIDGRVPGWLKQRLNSRRAVGYHFHE